MLRIRVFFLFVFLFFFFYKVFIPFEIVVNSNTPKALVILGLLKVADP